MRGRIVDDHLVISPFFNHRKRQINPFFTSNPGYAMMVPQIGGGVHHYGKNPRGK